MNIPQGWTDITPYRTVTMPGYIWKMARYGQRLLWRINTARRNWRWSLATLSLSHAPAVRQPLTL